MPTAEHLAWNDYFRQCPEQAVSLLSTIFDVPVSSYRATRVEPPEVVAWQRPEGQVDVVVTLRDEAGSPTTAIVVEIQRGQDDKKRFTWPMYLTILRARWQCPVLLLVVCPNQKLVRWCSKPIETGHPAWVLRPLVVGPDLVPVVADPAEALENPELAVLSALAHGGDDTVGRRVLEAMVAGFAKVETNKATRYTDLVQAALSSAGRNYVEKLMIDYEFKTDFAKSHRAEGRVEGEARSILQVLTNREISISDAVEKRVRACTDQATLDVWLQRALSVESAEKLFD